MNREASPYGIFYFNDNILIWEVIKMALLIKDIVRSAAD